MKTKKILDHFLGKPITVLTVPTNRDFEKENPNKYPNTVLTYFVGILEAYDENGLLLKQIMSPNGLKSFYLWDRIVGICEEEILDPTAPENQNVLEQFVNKSNVEKALQDASPKPSQQSSKLNPSQLNDLIKKLDSEYKKPKSS